MSYQLKYTIIAGYYPDASIFRVDDDFWHEKSPSLRRGGRNVTPF